MIYNLSFKFIHIKIIQNFSFIFINQKKKIKNLNKDCLDFIIKIINYLQNF